MIVESDAAAPVVTKRAVPRIALTKAEAPESLGISVGSLNKYVLPDVKVIRRGTIVLIPVAELERWAERSSDYTLGAGR
jgi:hypothetical protein